MSWFLTTLWWYFILLLLGLIFFPVTKKIFGRFFHDFGYPFAKVIGILFLSYTIFVLGTLKILPFTQPGLLLLIFIFVLINFSIQPIKQLNQLLFPENRKRLRFILAEELLFFIALLFWVIVRGQEPSIRGLEKFMDFGFINSILRSKYFPPLDMWLSNDPTHLNGYPINYYYFGHLTGAVLTKLAGIASDKTYNLILATIFALGITQTFSLSFNIIVNAFKRMKSAIIGGFLATFLVNFGGNLHPIYLFTTGYTAENPLPFWRILSGFNPTKYWYPNATRFIPLTIHEFPIYSWVVADLHGHVFDIPFVLLTLAILFLLFSNFKFQISKTLFSNFYTPISIFLGFLTAVHYMTNAFNGPIYIFLATIVIFFLFKFSRQFFINLAVLVLSFIIFTLPFSFSFSPFASGIGVNCPPDFLVNLKKLGPFLFLKENCQVSPLWMLLILWGFFLFNFIFLIVITRKEPSIINNFVLVFFSFGTFLIVIPEFFYIKDIYPAHFRANTMFKLGYQAFIIMGIASAYTYILFKQPIIKLKNKILHNSYLIIHTSLFLLVAIYPYFAITSYYGKLEKTPNLDGSSWIKDQYSEYKEIIDYFNTKVTGRPTILEAQGDSYTDFNVVSSYTGLPTVAGWWVHEWLWRGNADVVGKRIPDVQTLYESDNLQQTENLIKKYQIKYVIFGTNEKTKYPKLKEEKFTRWGEIVFTSSNRQGKIYRIGEPS